ncbi:MAG: hypothetical protein L6R37_004717 [Teloschistes peruensis]|nr:MAG: hypothetical protein L6R37_004717 [Teloschistes peruensis]
MYATITLAFSISSLFIGNTMAAPVGLPPNARDIITSPTSNIDTPAVAPKPVRRNPEEVFGSLSDLVFPQKISPSPTSITASSTFEFRIHTKSTATPASHESRNLAKKAQQPGKPFGGLSDLSFPQKVSASSSSAPAPTATSADAIGNAGSISFDPRDLAKKAPGASSEDDPFGGLDELSFPQKISASASASTTSAAPTASASIGVSGDGSISFDP